MLKPTDIRVGNLIQYDHDERRQPPVCVQRGFVKEIHSDGVVLTNGEKRKWERTEGLPLDTDLLVKFGFKCIWAASGDGQTWEKGIVQLHGDMFPLRLSNHEKDWICFPEINFAHQLQNLNYCLTGHELEITVP